MEDPSIAGYSLFVREVQCFSFCNTSLEHLMVVAVPLATGGGRLAHGHGVSLRIFSEVKGPIWSSNTSLQHLLVVTVPLATGKGLRRRRTAAIVRCAEQQPLLIRVSCNKRQPKLSMYAVDFLIQNPPFEFNSPNYSLVQFLLQEPCHLLCIIFFT